MAEFLMKRHVVAGHSDARDHPGTQAGDDRIPWPGNVRELENFMRKFLIFARRPDAGAGN